MNLMRTWYIKIRETATLVRDELLIYWQRDIINVYNKRDKICPESTQAYCYGKKHGIQAEHDKKIITDTDHNEWSLVNSPAFSNKIILTPSYTFGACFLFKFTHFTQFYIYGKLL